MNYRYNEKLKEISIARNQSSTASKMRGIKYTIHQAKMMRNIALLEEAPIIESILTAFPKISNHKADKMLEDVKRIRKEFTILCSLNDVAGIHNVKSNGFIYLIINESFKGWIKCGMTTNLVKRLATYNCYDPYHQYRFLIEKIVENKNKSETLLIYNLKNASENHKGEWFKIDEQIAIEIFNKI